MLLVDVLGQLGRTMFLGNARSLRVDSFINMLLMFSDVECRLWAEFSDFETFLEAKRAKFLVDFRMHISWLFAQEICCFGHG